MDASSSSSVQLVEKHCHKCEKSTEHGCSIWYPSDPRVTSVFNARAIIMICKDCEVITVQTEFIDGPDCTLTSVMLP